MGDAVGGEQGGVLGRDQELVQVAFHPVRAVDLGDLAIGLVVDLVVAGAVVGDQAADPEAQHRPVAVPLHAHVHDPAPGGSVIGDRA